jgi:hypothetical protein
MQDQIFTWVIRTATAGITTVAATPVTAVQYAASSSNTAELLYFSISQSGSTTSAMDQVRVVRKSAAATVTAGVAGTSILDVAGGASGTIKGPTTTTTTGILASSEGTDGDEVFRTNFNVLSGYERDWQPNARIWIPVSGIIAIKIKAVVALTYDVTMVIRELK